MKNIKTKLVFFLSLIMISSLTAQDEITIPLSDPGQRGHLRINIYKGSVTIKGTNRKDVWMSYQTVEKNKDKLKTSEDGLKRISGGAMGLEVSEKGNKVDIESEHGSKELQLILEVPMDFDVSTETYIGKGVMISNVRGEIVHEGHHGDFKGESITGSVVCSTWNGDIEIDFTSMNTENPLAFTTYNGKVDLNLPASTKADLKLKTQRGEILTGFDVELVKQQSKTENSRKNGVFKVYLDEWVQGKINAGGPEIMAQTHNGNIYIRKK